MEYTRQQSLNLRLPRSVWVVGCGGVGYWTAYQLALSGVSELVLFDPDTVSDSNFNRIPYTHEDTGRNKAQVLAEHILRIRPGIAVVPMPVAFSPDIDPGGSDYQPTWLVATTDTWESRKMCRMWCQVRKVSYMEASAEGEFGGIAKTPAEFATEEEGMAGYASVPVWSGPCLSAALLACAHIIHGRHIKGDVVRMGWDGNQVRLEEAA